MRLLDITVVSVALPSIQRDLRASLAGPAVGERRRTPWCWPCCCCRAATLGDRLGLTPGRSWSAWPSSPPGSLACARARTALALQLFRASRRESAGAAPFATATPLLRGGVLRRPALARALGVFGASRGAASAIGPGRPALLTDTLGWRSIFFVNLPIGVAAFAGGVARLRDPRPGPAAGPTGWARPWSPGRDRADVRADPRQRDGLGEPGDRGPARGRSRGLRQGS